MMKQHPGRGIHIRMRILRLPMLGQHRRRNLGILLHEPIDRIGGDILARVGEVDEGSEARVGLPEDAVAVAGDDLA